MNFIIYIFSAAFILMALALMFAYYRTHHYGMFIMGITYGTGAVLALLRMEWWPLVAAFCLVWVLRMMGLDPGLGILDRNTEDKQGDSPSSKEG